MERVERLERFEQMMPYIEQADRIVILRHKNPDPDALGSQLGLKALLQGAYPTKEIFALGSMIEEFSFMGEMDHITQEQFEQSLIIITDTANTPRIDTPFEITSTQPIIKIDHHPNDDAYGLIQCVDTTVSSTSELIVEFSLASQERLPMIQRAAQLLYTGILGDTGRFLFPNTSSRTFEIASYLIQFEVDHSELANRLITRTHEVSQLAGYMLLNTNVSPAGSGSIILTKELLEQFTVEDSQTSSLVSIPGTIERVVCWGIFVEQRPGFFRCRLRSKGPVINDIAKNHDGGGHPLAAGANAYSLQEVHDIIEELNERAKLWYSTNELVGIQEKI